MTMKYTISRDQGFIKFDRSSHGVINLSAETSDDRKCVFVRRLSNPRLFVRRAFLNIGRNKVSYNIQF